MRKPATRAASKPLSRSIPLYDAKAHFSRLVDRASRGDEITITKHGKPVARLIPAERVASNDASRKVIDRWIERRKPLLRGLSIRAMIEEGRK